MTRTSTRTSTGTGKIEIAPDWTRHGGGSGIVRDGFAFVTRLVRIPVADILAVRRPSDGTDAAVLVTRRNAMRVAEPYSLLMREIYGVEIATAEGGAR